MITTPTVGVAPTDTAIVSNSPSLGDTTTYVKYPDPNSGVNQDTHCNIQRIISYADGSVSVRWAGGNFDFTKNWADRASGTTVYDYIKQ